MRSDILRRYPSSSVRVYAIWFDMLGGDSRTLVDRRLLNDPRVTNYYDPRKVVGSWFAEHVDHRQGITWDAYFLYGADATWTDTPGPLVSSGSSVIGSSGDLAAAFKKVGSAS